MGFPVVPSGFSRFFSGKPFCFPANFPADAQKQQENSPRRSCPSICRFRPAGIVPGGFNHTVAPVLFFITFHKTVSVSFWNFVGFSRISTVRRGMSNEKSSYTLYDLPVFCPPALPQVPNRRQTSFRQPRWLRLFSWFLLDFSQGQRPRTLGIFPADPLGLPAGFMEKSWHFNYCSLKSSLSGGHRFLPVHCVSVVMFHATLENRRVFRLQNFLLTNLLHCIQPFVSVGATDSSPILLRIIIPFCKLSPSVRHGQFFCTFSR